MLSFLLNILTNEEHSEGGMEVSSAFSGEGTGQLCMPNELEDEILQ